uniref:Uncharacterized protein n=1 Tax=Physcomitrium patens TaxID=3218 RepID=A0A2K1ITD0_PHYPA|nr:hypothetical protein PHYPA_024473 [Physcomitrium patens]PNR32549.1 hypothetical protein PHYPA_024491 [Physcomitrium patens]
MTPSFSFSRCVRPPRFFPFSGTHTPQEETKTHHHSRSKRGVLPPLSHSPSRDTCSGSNCAVSNFSTTPFSPLQHTPHKTLCAHLLELDMKAQGALFLPCAWSTIRRNAD